ncbi:hypothetical protein DesfrDRAFT_2632 [Solidesulfovibrio fructosivorans JJ]]|uniref:Uncharacterized protein n=1 Tax=Solidesulfovibrio fructosivorans JJ] TaxID=596151 RepID=E1JYB7_SOLFR|nr:hypothetical protein [Solidesulfovibrio fructosivorans]EFL50691.1 hypothetical protein DesfrDRAFT_2632 [Solidesulfovibrio fructosivorans JJ]]
MPQCIYEEDGIRCPFKTSANGIYCNAHLLLMDKHREQEMAQETGIFRHPVTVAVWGTKPNLGNAVGRNLTVRIQTNTYDAVIARETGSAKLVSRSSCMPAPGKK